MVRYCSKCGTQLIQDAVFCSRCGNRFEQLVQPSPVEQQTSPQAQPIQQQPAQQSYPPDQAQPQPTFVPPQQATRMQDSSSIWYQNFYRIRKKGFNCW